MPTYNPSILISDCYGSAGSITFHHRDGKCRWRRRSSLSFTGTPSQCAALSVHRRALAAWRTIPDTEKERWHDIAKNVPPHRPPFGYGCHISGHNLFVSAYHGFVTLDSEPTENMADLKLVIMASAPQSNGVTRAYSKAVGIGTPKDPVSDEYDLKAEFDARHGAPSDTAPKVFMKWFFVDTTTGEVSGEQMALAQLTAATEPDSGV